MEAQTGGEIFAAAIRTAVAAGCADWGYKPVPQDWFTRFDGRVPTEIAEQVGAGIRDGLITTEGYYFRAAGLPPQKGPYKLVGKGGSGGTPQPHWEYYVQLAEYVRLVRRLGGTGLSIGFEDGLMDVSVRRGDDLLWCIEVGRRISAGASPDGAAASAWGACRFRLSTTYGSSEVTSTARWMYQRPFAS